MPHKTTKKIKEKVTEKRKAAQVKAAKQERKRVEQVRRRKAQVRRVKRRATQPVRNVRAAGENIRETGAEAAQLARAKTPFVSTFEEREQQPEPSPPPEPRTGGFLDDLSSTFESLEDDVFGGAGADGVDHALDEMLDGLDEDVAGKDGDFDIDLKGL